MPHTGSTSMACAGLLITVPVLGPRPGDTAEGLVLLFLRPVTRFDFLSPHFSEVRRMSS